MDRVYQFVTLKCERESDIRHFLMKKGYMYQTEDPKKDLKHIENYIERYTGDLYHYIKNFETAISLPKSSLAEKLGVSSVKGFIGKYVKTYKMDLVPKRVRNKTHILITMELARAYENLFFSLLAKQFCQAYIDGKFTEADKKYIVDKLDNEGCED